MEGSFRGRRAGEDWPGHSLLAEEGDGALQIRHKDIAAGDTHLEVSVSGKAKLKSKGGHEKDLAVSVVGRASARICRMTAAK